MEIDGNVAYHGVTSDCEAVWSGTESTCLQADSGWVKGKLNLRVWITLRVGTREPRGAEHGNYFFEFETHPDQPQGILL